jgi:hypothetical protein
MRSSAATDEYARAETDPLITLHITDLQHQRSSSGVLTIGFSQITQGAGLPREGVQWHRRSADQAQLHAAPCAWTTHPLRHLLSRAANVLICRIEVVDEVVADAVMILARVRELFGVGAHVGQPTGWRALCLATWG